MLEKEKSCGQEKATHTHTQSSHSWSWHTSAEVQGCSYLPTWAGEPWWSVEASGRKYKAMARFEESSVWESKKPPWYPEGPGDPRTAMWSSGKGLAKERSAAALGPCWEGLTGPTGLI